MGFLLRLLGRLPLPALHRLGAFFGWLVYHGSATYRRHLNDNLAQAGFPPSLRSAVASESGKQALEVLHLWTHSLDEIKALMVEVTGWELFEAARARGKGIVFLTPHLGCFDITAQYVSCFSDVTVLYRPPRQPYLQTLMVEGRKRERMHLAPTDLSGVRTLIKALRKGQAVGMLPDQAPRAGEGAWLDYFGRPAYTMTLAARLTETEATTIMVWCERLPKGRGFRMHFSEPSAPLTGDTLARATQINREIEQLVRHCPTQYLWGYNRYKRPAGADAPPSRSTRS